MSIIPNAYRKSLDQREEDLDDLTEARWELEYMEARVMNHIRDELISLANEVKINGGNPGLESAIDYAFQITGDVAFDGYAKLMERAIEVSAPLSVEYRKQGVA